MHTMKLSNLTYRNDDYILVGELASPRTFERLLAALQIERVRNGFTQLRISVPRESALAMTDLRS